MPGFIILKAAVDAQIKRMSAFPLYRMAVSKDLLYETYLSSFPEGTNPIYKERSEHDCNCCKNFIRNVGSMVAIIDNKLVSIWDVEGEGLEYYKVVADALSALVKSFPIDNVFLHTEPVAGVDSNLQDTPEGVKTWNHFFTRLPKALVVAGADIGTTLGNHRSVKDVFFRGLTELTQDSFSTVIELVAQNSLYRGAEMVLSVEAFQKLKTEFDKLTNDTDRDIFCWSKVGNVHPGVLAIRNSAIGTLLQDLSEGKDLEYSVKSFETKVAPTNYKRPTALVTKSMIEGAKKTIVELGLESALERRYAHLGDITVNNILFADRNTKTVMAGGVFDVMSASLAEKVKNFDKVEEIGIEAFLTNILPTATSIEVLLENRHTNNLVSLIAPVHADAKEMFKWPNKFSWSYVGEMADSYIRAEVQARGGRVDGVLRFSHSWNHEKRNASLMDLHVFIPSRASVPADGCHDNYGTGKRVGWNRRNDSKTQGVQDVDYTSEAPKGYIPVENITFPRLDRMPEGVYTCKIHNWQLRNPTEGGFKAEIEFGGEVFQYEVDRPLKHKEWITVAEVTLKNGVFSIKHFLPVGSAPKTIWELPTQTFHRTSVVMMSPNHWDEKQVGNKHYFFMLEGCLNEGTSRPFFNEFLSEELNTHRKVLEMVGSKMKTEESSNQLSGIGFSSTVRNSVLCRVKGSFNRVVKIVF